MSKELTASDLLDTTYRTIALGARITDAISAMLDARTEGCGADSLLVLDGDGTLRGLLTTQQLFGALLSRWVTDDRDLDDRKALEERLFDQGRDYLQLPVEQLMNAEVETLEPGDRLPRMMRLFVKQALQSIPVVETDKILGVVLVVDLYKSVAALALTPEDEGIRLDR